MNFKYLTLTIPLSFLWEYVAKKNELVVKLSVALSYIARFAIDSWFATGRLAAKISSFYTYINFGELMETFHDLFKPMIDICTSPFHFVRGYISVAQIYNHPYLIGFGSVTMISFVAWLIYKMGWNLTLQKYLQLILWHGH